MYVILCYSVFTFFFLGQDCIWAATLMTTTVNPHVYRHCFRRSHQRAAGLTLALGQPVRNGRRKGTPVMDRSQPVALQSKRVASQWPVRANVSRDFIVFSSIFFILCIDDCRLKWFSWAAVKLAGACLQFLFTWCIWIELSQHARALTATVACKTEEIHCFISTTPCKNPAKHQLMAEKCLYLLSPCAHMILTDTNFHQSFCNCKNWRGSDISKHVTAILFAFTYAPNPFSRSFHSLGKETAARFITASTFRSSSSTTSRSQSGSGRGRSKKQKNKDFIKRNIEVIHDQISQLMLSNYKL